MRYLSIYFIFIYFIFMFFILSNVIFRFILSFGFLAFCFFGSLGTYEYYVFFVFLSLVFWFYKTGSALVYDYFLIWFNDRINILKYSMLYKLFYLGLRIRFFFLFKFVFLIKKVLFSGFFRCLDIFYSNFDLSLRSFLIFLKKLN